MIAYEFYCNDPIFGYHVLGILPERRKNPGRITRNSVMNWGKENFGNTWDNNNIFFIKITIDENTGRIFRPIPFFVTQEIM
jgi:hypothetical protein